MAVKLKPGAGGGSFFIGSNQYPVNSMSVTYGTDRVEFKREGELPIKLPYTALQDGDGNPFADVAALQTFVDANFFKAPYEETEPAP